MTPKRQEELFVQFVNKQFETLCGKRSDYAESSDALSNFKQTGAITGVSSAQVALTLIGVKVARLGNLLSNTKTNVNESIEDSVLDLANYAFLLKCILVDNNEQSLIEAGIAEEEDLKRNLEVIKKTKSGSDLIVDAGDNGIRYKDIVGIKKIKCVVVGSYCSLTLNKIYDVISEDSLHYRIINDDGDSCIYSLDSFEVVQDVDNKPYQDIVGIDSAFDEKKKVRCINNNGYLFITTGKIYEVLKEEKYIYEFIRDNNQISRYNKELFEVVDTDIFKNIKKKD